MKLDRASLAELSRLLDQAMDLPAGQLEPWLAALPPEAARFVPQLRQVLARRHGDDSEPFLASPAGLYPDDHDVSVASPGDRVGPYVLLREIGSGGMGSVWLAEGADGGLQRQVALKLPRLAWGQGLAARMARERDIGARLEHPNVARLYDAGVDHLGRPYLAMEYIDGTPIDAWCRARQLDVPARLRLFLQVLHAVDYAHRRQVVHRDLKPSNVLVGADGRARLLDFGIAKLIDDASGADTGLTERLGRVLTPHYAAPEQLEGGTISVRTDVYCLGVLLFELLTGQLPYGSRRGSIGALEEAVLRGDAPLASRCVKDRTLARQLQGDVDAIIAKAMQREPAQRYAGADVMAADIEHHLGGRAISARADNTLQRLRRSWRHHWRWLSAAAAALVVLGTGGVMLALEQRQAQRVAAREQVVKEFVTDMLRSYPAGAGGLHRWPAELLEKNAELIQKRFSGQPELQAELFGIVGGLFGEMGAHTLALAYAKRQAALLESLHAAATQMVAPLLLQAESQLELGDPAAALAATQAALMRTQDDARRQARAQVVQARALVELGRLEQARQALAQVQALTTTAAAPLAREMAWAAGLQAEMLVRSGRLDDAFAGYEKAAAMALAGEGPGSISAATIRLLGARWYRAMGDAERTRRLFEPAIDALRAAGGVHGIRAAVESARQWQPLYATQQRVASGTARAAIEQSLAELRSYGDLVPPSLTATVQMWLARVLQVWGDVAGAQAIVDRHGAAALAGAGHPLERLYLLGTQALIALDSGRHEEAVLLFEQGRQARVAAGRDRQALAVRDFHGLAVSAILAGRPEQALQVLHDIPQPAPSRMLGARAEALSDRTALLQGRALLDLGQAAAAEALVSALHRSSPDTLLVDAWVSSAGLLGEARCQQGRAAQGLLLLRAHLAGLNPDHHPHAPKLAWLNAITGLCALQAGDRQGARQLCDAARAAFTAQSEVSPYYKAPWLRLEQALAAQAR